MIRVVADANVVSAALASHRLTSLYGALWAEPAEEFCGSAATVVASLARVRQ